MTSDITIIAPMTRSEAQECLLTLRQGLSKARKLALDFSERRGWEALGYESLAACFQAELGYSPQHGYRLLKAAQIEQEISPMGETTIPERHARELAKLPTSEARIEAYQAARTIAAGEDTDTVTTRHVEQAVSLTAAKLRVMGSKYFPIAQMMTTGVVAPLVAQAMVEAVDALPPKKRGYIMQLIGGPGLTCAELIPALAEMFDRPPGKESYVLPEVLNAGTLGGTLLKDANLTDLARAREEAQKQRLSDIEEAKREARPEWVRDPVTINMVLTFGTEHNEKLRRQVRLLDSAHRATLRHVLMEE